MSNIISTPSPSSNPFPYGNFGIDAGVRTRVSQLTTLLDGKLLQFEDQSDNSGMFQNQYNGLAPLRVGNRLIMSISGINQYSIRQSKRFYPYFSGKSQLIECTFDRFQTQAGVTKRFGYYSSSADSPFSADIDGFYFEDDGVSKSLQIKNLGTTVASIPFASMDNYALVASYDWSKFTVVAFDFLWLGGATLRMWLKTDLGFVLLHTYNHTGLLDGTMINSPNQPVRYEMRTTADASGQFGYICSQVSTEGSINESGRTKSLINDTAIATNSTALVYALKGIKKRNTYRDVATQITEISVVNTSNADSGILMLLLNPTLSAPLTYVNNESIEEGTATNQTVTGLGKILAAAPASYQGGTDAMKENFLSFLSQSINDIMDEYILAYKPVSSNQSVHGILTVKSY
jgi:hypothetical protein